MELYKANNSSRLRSYFVTKRIIPPEELTDGYSIINLSFGADIRMKNQIVSFSLQIKNLFNSKYFSHTGYYRLINVPEPGRNFVLNVSLPIRVKLIN